MLTIEKEAEIVWGMLTNEYGEGVGFMRGISLFVNKEKRRELGNIAYNLDEDFHSLNPENNYKFGDVSVFKTWYEFEKSLPDSPYFKEEI